MGPPGQAGFQGGPGLQGNMGPRGMALQGKLVSKFLIFFMACSRIPQTLGYSHEIVFDIALFSL